jgi:mRNA-degrading endonuclease RelE of RelBE toxin-antitoxin system
MFSVGFTESAQDDLRSLAKAEQVAVLDAVQQHLSTEPLKATRNKKPLRPNALGQWELRVGVVRVFYDVDESANEVKVKAVGRKEHNKLFIRGKEHTL